MTIEDMREWYGDAADVMFDFVESPLALMLENGCFDDVLRPFRDRYGSDWVNRFVKVDEIANQLSMLSMGWPRTDDMVKLGEVLLSLSD